MNGPERLSWPVEELGEAVDLLLAHGGLGSPRRAPPPGPRLPPDPERIGEWLAARTEPHGVEVEPVDTTYAEVDSLLGGSPPALLRLPGEGGSRFLALAEGGSRTVTVIAPDRSRVRVPVAALRREVCAALEAPLLPALDRLLDEAAIPRRSRPRVRRVLLEDRLGPRRIGGCWLLRPGAGAPPRDLARHARLPRLLAALLAGHLAQYLLWILGWYTLGRGALSARLDAGWVAGWLATLLSIVPLRAAVLHWQGLLGLRSGVLLKTRLLRGALRLPPDQVRRQGAGQLLGRVIDSEAVAMIVAGGGLPALLGSVELAVAAGVLALGAGGPRHALLLAAWITAVTALGWRYGRACRRWTAARLEMTHDLVERMAGHRTRVAQEDPPHRHAAEDEQVEGYLRLSAGMDRAAVRLLSLGTRGWLPVGILGLLPAFVGGEASPGALAVGLGGVLLAWQALGRLVPAVVQIVDAAIAWRRVRGVFRAAARKEVPGTYGALPASLSGCVLEADGLGFRYSRGGRPVVEGVSLKVSAGDRLRVEGPSGAGKSTLASLLAGLREPEAGSLLLGGLDRWTVGAREWRRRVGVVPQFHENHVLADTLAFNVLMGRGWPPSDADLAEAEHLLRELGLGEMLDRMPSGMMQMVGDGGWQLSHGERSRVYLARALLQGAEVLLLDESFAALDPGSLARVLRVVEARAPTLVVIAHP
ncbi:MAG TPA: ABC transporter ATP-binding protein [Longimicrobiaceae bacterium]|nr:ABC transporter ATP-binding protein [Longimicrobiaceae bacterium]